MAAAEYFATAPTQSPPNQSSPYPNPPQPQRTSSGPAWTPQQQQQQQQHPAPPPYQPIPQEQKPGVHFASPPQRHSFSGQQRPSFSTTPPQNSYAQPQRQHQGSWNGPTPPMFAPPPTSVPYGTPPHQHGYLAAPTPPHMRPYTNPNHSQYTVESGYSSDPEPRRRRRKHRDRHHSDASRDVRDSKSHSRSTKSDAFIGAAGGGLIGDLIFPGLGTLGGAALGWIGGKDYGNHRKWREEKRERTQRDWEDKYGQSHRGHSHDRHHNEKEKEKDRRQTYERRNSHY